jgi:hypothetical protein
MSNIVRVETERATGFTRCVDPSCPDFDVEIPLDLVREKRIERDSQLPVDVKETDYLHPADEAELACPSCGSDRMITDQAKRVIPNHLSGLAAVNPVAAGVPDTPVAQGLDPEVLAQAFVLAKQMQDKMDEEAA